MTDPPSDSDLAEALSARPQRKEHVLGEHATMPPAYGVFRTETRRGGLGERGTPVVSDQWTR